MDDYKARIKKAIENSARKELPKSISSPKRKNKTPEKLVQKECLMWLRSQGFDVTVVESKATYSAASGTYHSSPVQAGFSDLIGCDNNGILLAIELKAKGRRSTLKPHQADFLIEKIKRGAFAVCVDSAELLAQIYERWNCLAGEAAKKFLLDQLPQACVADDDSSLFSQD